MGVGMSRYAQRPGRKAKRIAAIAAAAAVLSGCGSVSSTLGAVSGAADLVTIGAWLGFASAGQTLDFERMEDAGKVLIIADEIGTVAGEGAEAAAAIEPLVEYMTEDATEE